MWIAIFIVFMSLLVVGVIVACVVYSKMDNGNTIADKTLEHIKEKNVEEDEEMEKYDDSSGEYEQLFPYVMFDEDDETVDDNDKFLDDMIFMDLMDED